MNNLPVYLDYAATTPVDPQVAAKMSQYLTRDGVFANPASRSHRLGWIAEEAVEEARQSVAQLVKADSREIVWTSGATEANNLAIKGIAYQHQHKGRHLISSVIEHKAVIDTLTFLQTQGFEVTWLKPDNRGVIHPDQVHSALREETILVSLMHVNNEIGSINDLAAIGAICRHSGVYFHVDAAQSFGKLPIDLSTLPVDLMSFSAHKIYGPKGIGALYVRQQPRIYLQAQIHGGGHERGMRSGTLPTHQIVAMGEAAKIAAENMQDEHTKLLQLRQQFLKHIQGIESVSLNASTADKTQEHTDSLPSCSHLFPGIMNVSVAGVDGEVLLMALGDIAVSTGSACNSASLAPSYVLKGIGLSDELALSSLRISIGRYTTEQEIDQAAMQFCEVVTTLTRQNNSAPVTFSL